MVKHITSPSNPAVRALLQSTDDYLIFEGKTLVSDILARDIPIAILIVRGTGECVMPGSSRSGIDETWVVSSSIMKKVSELKTASDIIAVIREGDLPSPPVPEGVIIAMENIQDPGNMGTIFRCAAAFNTTAVCLIGHCVRVTNRKFLRAAQTAVFDLAIHRFPRFRDFETWCRTHGLTLYVTSPRHSSAQSCIESLQTPAVLIFGNEARGLTKDAMRHNRVITIPQEKQIDSLNVAVSACIIMHQLYTLEKR